MANNELIAAIKENFDKIKESMNIPRTYRLICGNHVLMYDNRDTYNLIGLSLDINNKNNLPQITKYLTLNFLRNQAVFSEEIVEMLNICESIDTINLLAVMMFENVFGLFAAFKENIPLKFFSLLVRHFQNELANVGVRQIVLNYLSSHLNDPATTTMISFFFDILVEKNRTELIYSKDIDTQFIIGILSQPEFSMRLNYDRLTEELTKDGRIDLLNQCVKNIHQYNLSKSIHNNAVLVSVKNDDPLMLNWWLQSGLMINYVIAFDYVANNNCTKCYNILANSELVTRSNFDSHAIFQAKCVNTVQSYFDLMKKSDIMQIVTSKVLDGYYSTDLIIDVGEYLQWVNAAITNEIVNDTLMNLFIDITNDKNYSRGKANAQFLTGLISLLDVSKEIVCDCKIFVDECVSLLIGTDDLNYFRNFGMFLKRNNLGSNEIYRNVLLECLRKNNSQLIDLWLGIIRGTELLLIDDIKRLLE